MLLGYDDTTRVFPASLREAEGAVTGASGLLLPSFILAGSDGLAYGRFVLDSTSREVLLERIPQLDDALVRSVAWMALWEAMLVGEVDPPRLVALAQRALPLEADEQNIQYILGFLRSAYWRFLAEATRRALAPDLETLLWEGIRAARDTSRKAALFDTYIAVALSPDAVARLERLWSGTDSVPGLPLAERHYTRLAEALALRGAPRAAEVLAAQLERIENPDRRARFAFVMPALSSDPTVRDSAFLSFREAANRTHEPWVLSAVSALHHPLRADSAVKYILPSLELLEEIQRTGDIFFPLRWLDATLGGHNTPAAAEAVIAFLNGRPNYPTRLTGKVLQAADHLLRAAEIVHGWDGAGAASRLGRDVVRR